MPLMTAFAQYIAFIFWFFVFSPLVFYPTKKEDGLERRTFAVVPFVLSTFKFIGLAHHSMLADKQQRSHLLISHSNK